MSPYFSFASDYVKENESDKGIGKWGCVLARREIVGVQRYWFKYMKSATWDWF